MLLVVLTGQDKRSNKARQLTRGLPGREKLGVEIPTRLLRDYTMRERIMRTMSRHKTSWGICYTKEVSSAWWRQSL